MRGWIAIAVGIVLICVGAYYLGHVLEGMNFFADQ